MSEADLAAEADLFGGGFLENDLDLASISLCDMINKT